MGSDPSLVRHIKELKRQGMSAIQVQKQLREEGIGVPWVETRLVYQQPE